MPPLELRIKAHEEFESLRSSVPRKDVVERITKKHGLTKTTVYQWYKGQDPIGRRAGRVDRVTELLYVIGALLGDGCAYHWRSQFQVWLVGEEAFTAKFALKLSRCLGRKVKNYRYGSKNAWFVRVDNAELYFLFQSVRKDHSLVQKLVGEIDPVGGWVQFIEGLFDAEGCVKIVRGRERKTPKACLDFCNTDLDLVDLAKRVMKESLGIDASISAQHAGPPRKTSYHLRAYSKTGISRFLELLQTTKLTAEKSALVSAWLAKRR